MRHPAKQFLTDLFSGYEGMGFIETRSLTPKHQPHSPAEMKFYNSVDEVIHSLPSGLERDIYFGVLPRAYRSGNKSAINQARVLWVDIDSKTRSKEDCINALYSGSVPSPNYLVDSGGGIHCYWLLEDTIPPELAEDTNYRLQDTLSGDKCWNADRILRVPGTYNLKIDGLPRQTRVLSCFPTRYHSSDFNHLPPAVNARKLDLGVMVPLQPETCVLLDDPRYDLPDFVLQYIEHGLAADIHDTFKGDRSRLDFYVMGKLLRNGLTPNQVAGVFLNEDYAISEKTLSKPGRGAMRYLTNSISKAQGQLSEQLERV